MAAKRCNVSITANFKANLDVIETFLAAIEAQASYTSLLDTLIKQVISALQHYPDIGRSFLDRAVQSVEAQ